MCRNAPRSLILGALLGASACYTSRAPHDWLPKPIEVPSDPYGGWITLTANFSAGAREIEGELIAAERDTVHVMAFSELVSVPLDSVTELRLETFRAERAAFGRWTALGALMSLSHGYFFVLTGPLWITTGSLSAASYSRAPLIRTVTIDALRPYSRFPQGLPPGLDRKALRATNR